MKISFDYQIFDLQEYGGISRYIYELSKELSKSQDVLIASPIYKNHYLKKAPRYLKVFGFYFRPIPKLGKVRALINHLLSKFFLRFYRPEINHETYYSYKAVSPKGTKTVLTVYDMIHERFSSEFSVNDTTSSLKANSAKRANHIICISEQTKKDLIELFGIDESKVSVVYLGFSLAVNKNDIKTINYSKPYLLYVGNREGYKNFSALLKAYADSTSLRNKLDLVCFGGGVFSASELNLIKSLNLRDDAVKQVAGDDGLLARYYSSAKAFVYPSLYEGFGIPPLEAMSFNCPVVCSNISSIPEVVGEAAEFFDPYDVQSIKTAIEKVVHDTEHANDLVLRGNKRLDNFSWEKCARETLEVYTKVLQ